MQFDLEQAIEILGRTPNVLHALLYNLSPSWTTPNEGGDSWSAFDIVGHLIHGEKTDWIPRLEIILSKDSIRTFEPFDRFAQFEASKGRSLNELLNEFAVLRSENLSLLRSKQLTFRRSGREWLPPGIWAGDSGAAAVHVGGP